jgi:hypothetical protein
MADSSSSDYEWVIYLVVAFFMFVLPLLKKAADAVAGRKKGERRRGRPAGGEDKRGVLGEMLDEVEDYVRKAREEEPAAKPAKKKEIAPFDIWYQERKREIDKKRQRREERRRQRQMDALMEAGQAAVQEPEPQPVEEAVRQPALQPSIQAEVVEIPVIGEMEHEEITSLGTRDFEVSEIDEDDEGLINRILGDIPEMAQAIVMAEILTAPKFAESMD